MATTRRTDAGHQGLEDPVRSAGPGTVPAELETPDLVLRRAGQSDLPLYCERIYQDPEVMRMLPGQQALTPDEALPRAHALLVEHWSDHGFGPWLVIEKAGQRLIGHCGLRYWPDSTEVEVLYALEPAAWGRGHATQAARAAATAAFEQPGLERLIAGAATGNQASIAVLRKLGMRRWARCRFRGLDLEMFAVSRQRWVAHGSGPCPAAPRT